jgi:hypothetical protein
MERARLNQEKYCVAPDSGFHNLEENLFLKANLTQNAARFESRGYVRCYGENGLKKADNVRDC